MPPGRPAKAASPPPAWDPLQYRQFLELARAFQVAENQQAAMDAGIGRYLHDPVGFIDNCVTFRGGGLTAYQREIMAALIEHKRVAVRGPHGLGKCMRASDLVRLADGSLASAASLIGRRFAVLARGEYGGVEAAGAWATDNGIKPVVQITTDKGRVLTRTLNHPLWADPDPKGHSSPLGRGRVRPEGSWVPAGDLQPGAAVAVYLRNEGASVSAPRDEVVVLAGLLTDGCTTSLTDIGFSQQPGLLLDDFTAAAMACGSRLVYRAGVDYDIRAAKRYARGPGANGVRDLAARWGLLGCSAHGKAMPPEVWTWDDKSLALLLNRMLSCDGWAHCGRRPNGKVNREVGYCTVSRALAVDVQRAFLRLGIQAECRSKRTSWTHGGVRKTGTAWTVAVHDIAGVTAFCERVGIKGKEDQIDALRASCDSADWRRQQRWRQYQLGEAFAWERVKKVDLLEPEPTVAITVPGPQTFITDFLEHNTSVSALVILWFALTREATGCDWKCVATAGGWRQLEHYLWPEVRKWSKRLVWAEIGRGQFDERSELMALKLKLRMGEAFAAASDKPELIEGAHADSILYIFDESKAIIAGTFDAAEGAFSGAEADESMEAFALAMSTPGEPSGRFYDIHCRAPGTEDWWTRHVTLDEAIDARRVSRKWAEQRARQWGTTTAVYNNRVLGEFWSSDEDAIVPLSWIEAANDRWRAWAEDGRPQQPGPYAAGVDIARSGEDRSVIAIREGQVIIELRTAPREDTMATTGRVKGILDANPDCTAIVDVIGIGAGVVDRLREMKAKVEAFTASAGTKRRDASNELGFSNLRSAAWWNLREILDPARGATMALPPDDLLTGDLTAVHWKPMSGGKIMVESKDDIRKRIGRSTDYGDAVMQACWGSGVSWLDAYNVIVCEKCERAQVRREDRAECPYCRHPLGAGEEAA